MPKIININFNKKANLFELEFDDKKKIVFDAELVLEKNLFKSKILSEEVINQYLKESIYKRLLRQGIIYLSIKPRSIWELEHYLTSKISKWQEIFHLNKEYSFTHLISSVINELKKRNYLNDYQFALSLIEQQIEVKGKGIKFIYTILLKKRIDRDIINSIINNKYILSAEKINSSIDKSITKITSIIKSRHLDKNKAWAMLTRRLLAKGFEHHQIRNKIDEWIRSEYNK